MLQEKGLTRSCDFIIDDGSHHPDHQIFSFKYLWEKVMSCYVMYSSLLFCAEMFVHILCTVLFCSEMSIFYWFLFVCLCCMFVCQSGILWFVFLFSFWFFTILSYNLFSPHFFVLVSSLKFVTPFLSLYPSLFYSLTYSLSLSFSLSLSLTHLLSVSYSFSVDRRWSQEEYM